jgi:hypothetical protein
MVLIDSLDTGYPSIISRADGAINMYVAAASGYAGAGTKFLSDDGKYRNPYSAMTGNYTDWDYFVPTNYFSGNIGTGNTTIFTVPAGKRLMVLSAIASSTNTAGVSAYPQILTNGNYYTIYTSATVLTNSPTSFVSSANPQIYEENEAYAINTSATGLNVFVSGFLFSTASNLKPIRAFNIGVGPTAIYTVPAGKYAVAAFNTGFPNPYSLAPLLMNKSGGSRVYSFYIVPNGASVDLTTRVWGVRTISDDSLFPLSASNLSAGGAFWMASDSAAAGQHVFGAVVEVPTP